MVQSFGFSKKELTPSTKLIDVLPKKNRMDWIQQIESKLGFSVNVLRPKDSLVYFLLLMFFASLFSLFWNWKIGLSGIVVALVGWKFAYKLGNEINCETLGDLAKKISRERYLLIRRDQNSFNPIEIEPIIFDLFTEELNLDKTKLNRDSRFIGTSSTFGLKVNS